MTFGANEELRELPVVASENGMLETSLYVRPMVVNYTGAPGIWAYTRSYNCSFPSPILRFRRGDLVKVNVVNLLEADDVSDPSNAPPWTRREGQVGVPTDSVRFQNVDQDMSEGANFQDPLGSPPTLMYGTHNNAHGANTTNLHVHGLHVSQQFGQDDVLDVNIYPKGHANSSFDYEYEISAYHAGGSHWYHPHWHGSVTSQVGQGMTGAVIVEDSEGEVPQWLARMREVVGVFNELAWNYFGDNASYYAPYDAMNGCFPFGSSATFVCALQHRTALMAYIMNDTMFKSQRNPGFGFQPGETHPIEHFFSVNGQYQPTLKVSTGEWVRFRMIYAGHNIPLKLALSSGCQWLLIAKDGVYLEEYPRKLLNKSHVWLGPANRADVIMRCNEPGKHIIWVDNYQSLWQSKLDAQNTPQPDPNLTKYFDFTWNQTVLYVEAKGPPEHVPSPPPRKFKAVRPKYLANLRDVPLANLQKPNLKNVPVCPPNTTGDPTDCRYDYVQVGLVSPDGITLNQIMNYDFPNGLTLGPTNTNSSTTYAEKPVRFVINNETFRGHGSKNQLMVNYKVGGVQQLILGGMDKHSWHLHEIPVQLMDVPCKTGNEQACNGQNYLEKWGGYFLPGDWHDAVMIPTVESYDVSAATPSLPNTTVRYYGDCYTGLIVIHCHVLYHEDMGMFTVFNTSGTNHFYSDRFPQQGVFKFPPAQCMKKGQNCARPWCTKYKYGYGS